MPTIDDYLNRVRALPMARVTPDLLRLLKRPNLDSSRVITLIGRDPVLTAGVLRICNSALFGAATPIENLEEAVTRLGFQELYRTVAAASGSRLLGSAQAGYGMGQGELWKHSFVTATAAQLIARKVGEDENLAFTAGLLHDIGKVILSPALEKAEGNPNADSQPGLPFVEVERKLLEVNHAEVGGRLLERWDFPPGIVSAVWFHHAPKGARADRRLAALVYLGNMTACLMGHAYGHLGLALRARGEVFGFLGLAPDSLPGFMLATFEQLETPEARSAMGAV